MVLHKRPFVEAELILSVDEIISPMMLRPIQGPNQMEPLDLTLVHEDPDVSETETFVSLLENMDNNDGIPYQIWV